MITELQKIPQTLLNILLWIFGIFGTLVGLASIGKYPINSLIIISSGLLLLPPIFCWLIRKYPKLRIRYVLIISLFLFLIGTISTPTNEETFEASIKRISPTSKQFEAKNPTATLKYKCGDYTTAIKLDGKTVNKEVMLKLCGNGYSLGLSDGENSYTIQFLYKDFIYTEDINIKFSTAEYEARLSEEKAQQELSEKAAEEAKLLVEQQKTEQEKLAEEQKTQHVETIEKAESAYIEGLYAADVYKNLENIGFTCEKDFVDDPVVKSIWYCEDSSSEYLYNVEISTDLQSRVLGVEAMSTNLSSKSNAEISKDFLGYVATITYENATPNESSNWVKTNFGRHDFKNTVAGVDFHLYETNRTSLLMIHNENSLLFE